MRHILARFSGEDLTVSLEEIFLLLSLESKQVSAEHIKMFGDNLVPQNVVSSLNLLNILNNVNLFHSLLNAHLLFALQKAEALCQVPGEQVNLYSGVSKNSSKCFHCFDLLL